MKKFILAFVLLLLVPTIGISQTWVTANQVTLGWNAVPPIQATDTIKYQCYTKYGSASATPQPVGGEITATQQTISFSVEGRYYLCAETLRYPQGETVPMRSQRMACTDVAQDVQSGVPFGVVYFVAPASPVMLRLAP